MVVNSKDLQIIEELNKNSKQPYSNLAKKIKPSIQAIKNRINKLEKAGVIKGFTTVINPSKLGLLSYRIFMRTKSIAVDLENTLVKQLVEDDKIFWVSSLIGKWDLEIGIYASNFYEFGEILKSLLEKHQEHIRSYQISMVTEMYYLREDEHNISQIYLGGKPSKIQLDKIDCKILNLLASNSRMTNTEISEKIKIVPNAIRYRIKSLEKKGIIKEYRIWVDYIKLGINMKKVLITTQMLTSKIENKMLQFCHKHIKNMFFTKCIGPWDIEFELYSEPFAVRKAQARFRHEFANEIKDIEILTIEKEYKMHHFPCETLD